MNNTKFILTLVQNHAKSSLNIQNLKVLLSLLQVIMTCIFIVPKYDNLEWSSGAFDQLEGTDITYFQRVISRNFVQPEENFTLDFFIIMYLTGQVLPSETERVVLLLSVWSASWQNSMVYSAWVNKRLFSLKIIICENVEIWYANSWAKINSIVI